VSIEKTMKTPPANPAGEYVPEPNLTSARRAELIAEIEQAPRELGAAAVGLADAQLDLKYRNWSIRQIVQHIADSHAHSYIRCKWTLTEDQPLIKAYDENAWSALPDARAGDVAAPLALLVGVHCAWVQLLRMMTPANFARSFNHPETGQTVVLDDALSYYAWHGRHHTAQITWLRNQHGW
jgi:uncharacterized damage-inducible protein DinB